MSQSVRWIGTTVLTDNLVQIVDAVMKSEGGRDALYKERILAGGVNDQIK